MSSKSRNSSSLAPWKYLPLGGSMESESNKSSTSPPAPWKYLIWGLTSGFIYGSLTPLIKGEGLRAAAVKGSRLGLNHATLFGFYYVCTSAMSYIRNDSKFWNPVLPLVATCTFLPDPLAATQFATSLAAFEVMIEGGKLS